MDKQYNHILVPLDGSELAELALADAFSLARASGAEITLLQAVRHIEQVLVADAPYPIYLDQQWESRKRFVLGYLNEIRKRMGYEDITVHAKVRMGPAAETIIDYARRHPIDLIIMATHGRSGLQRWVYGSVADKVLRGADKPVLLVRAYSKHKVPKTNGAQQEQDIVIPS